MCVGEVRVLELPAQVEPASAAAVTPGGRRDIEVGIVVPLARTRGLTHANGQRNEIVTEVLGGENVLSDDKPLFH